MSNAGRTYIHVLIKLRLHRDVCLKRTTGFGNLEQRKDSRDWDYRVLYRRLKGDVIEVYNSVYISYDPEATHDPVTLHDMSLYTGTQVQTNKDEL